MVGFLGFFINEWEDTVIERMVEEPPLFVWVRFP